MTPEQFLTRLLYRDALMLVIDKPTGIPVHKGTGGGENLEQYFDHLKFGLPRTPALAHRLDRDTSGCLVLGRHRQALAKLAKLFEGGKIRKTYWAIVEGTPAEQQGTISLALAKKSQDSRRWHMKIAEAGDTALPAITEYQVMGGAAGMSWLAMRPLTGRTHQLRVHAKALGCPIAGDKIYGSADGMLQLHAREIEIPLYPKKDPVKVVAPVPEHMLENLKRCGFIS